MANPFLGEIRIFPFNFAPTGWAMCNGQLLSISQNTALFSLLGTNFGGNGTSTFGLPNLQGSAALHWGNGAGLTPRVIGGSGGEQTVTLLANQLPAHTHGFQATTAGRGGGGAGPSPSNTTLVSTTAGTPYVSGNPTSAMKASAIGASGGNGPHNNLMPYVTLNFCIATQGVFPARN